jgi:hypothetical protein
VGRSGEALHPPRSASNLEVWTTGTVSSTNWPGNLDVMHDLGIIIVDDATCLFWKGSKFSVARLECQVETLLLDKVRYGKARRKKTGRDGGGAELQLQPRINSCLNVLINIKLLDT